MTTISKDFTFAASHRLQHLPEGHPCQRLHGHNYVIRVTLEGAVDPATGFVLDYRALAPFGAWLDEHLDHQHLNDALPELFPGPTSERMAEHLLTVLTREVDLPLGVHTVTVGVSETPKTWAHSTATRDYAGAAAVDADRYRWGVRP